MQSVTLLESSSMDSGAFTGTISPTMTRWEIQAGQANLRRKQFLHDTERRSQSGRQARNGVDR